MNLRIVTFLEYEGDGELIKELVADFCEALIARGFANDTKYEDNKLNSLIAVKENVEVLEMPPEDFFESELREALLVVIPTDEAKEEIEKINPEDDAA